MHNNDVIYLNLESIFFIHFNYGYFLKKGLKEDWWNKQKNFKLFNREEGG